MNLLADDPAGTDPVATVLLAHGAGAPMDSAAMTRLAGALLCAGFAVRRFEFAYMAGRRAGARRPPPRAEALVTEFRSALEAVLAVTRGPVVLSGKSLGGRVATLLSGEPLPARAAAVAVFGYPFHPPDKPDRLRLQPLVAARLPVLIAQGERDPFGMRAEVADYGLPGHVRIDWYTDGDHDLVPRKASGQSGTAHAARAAATLKAFLLEQMAPDSQ